MKVRTLAPHWNKHGEFAIGDEYDSADPAADITLGHVENADDDKTDGVQGAGGKTGASERRNSQKQDAKGFKRGG